jgi:MFS family permease
MRGRELAGLILASALITLDGTAVTVALPAIRADLGVPFSRLQWIGNAPLLVMAALLMPAGVLADRFGRTRSVRLGTIVFAIAAAASAGASSGLLLIAARFLQGVSGALILPGTVAKLREAFDDPAERTRKFGVWAAWTGVASAVGPLLGGALADLVSWRGIFVLTAAAAITAFALLRRGSEEATTRAHPLSASGTIALTIFLSALSYLLIEGATATWTSPRVIIAGVCTAASTLALIREHRRQALLPPELLSANNCLPANGATFALYFGMFGLSFLLVLYTQQALGYSGVWAGLGLLPVSVMLFLAETFGRITTRLGTRAVIAGGSMVAGAGILWIAIGPEPLPFWSRIIVGTSLFGLGLSLAVSGLTHAAVSAVPESCAGAASGLNHATVRGAGLIAIALLGSLAADGGSDGMSAAGFRRAMTICGVLVTVGGAVAALRIKKEEAGGS